MICKIRDLTPYPDIIELAFGENALYGQRELMHGIDALLFKDHVVELIP